MFSDYMRTLKVELEIQSTFVDMYRSLLLACNVDRRVADMPPMRVGEQLVYHIGGVAFKSHPG